MGLHPSLTGHTSRTHEFSKPSKAHRHQRSGTGEIHPHAAPDSAQERGLQRPFGSLRETSHRRQLSHEGLAQPPAETSPHREEDCGHRGASRVQGGPCAGPGCPPSRQHGCRHPGGTEEIEPRSGNRAHLRCTRLRQYDPGASPSGTGHLSASNPDTPGTVICYDRSQRTPGKRGSSTPQVLGDSSLPPVNKSFAAETFPGCKRRLTALFVQGLRPARGGHGGKPRPRTGRSA